MTNRTPLRPLWRKLTACCLAALFCLFLSGTARADKRDWADSAYDFSRVRRVLLFDLDTAKMPDSTIDRRLAEDIFKRFAKDKLGKRLLSLEEAARLLDPEIDANVTALLASDREKAAALIREHAQRVADVFIDGHVQNWTNDSYIREAYTEWQQKAYTRTVKDKDGKTREETYYVSVPVYHPATRVWYSELQAAFEVRDAASGQSVMLREDTRDRDGSGEHDGMFERICKSFFGDLAKKIKA
ncbi:MAG: hypothetical protein ACTTH3_04720 [Schwartzia sp. (in: firmicutes)]